MAAVAALAGVPPMDALTLEFALAGVRALDLGGDASRTDLLAISLSTTDAVGHRFGPDSRELHDQVVRLDRSLGAFLDTLFTLRDSTRVVVALTADHGLTPIPGSQSTVTPNPGAVYVDPREVRAAQFARMHAAGIDTMQVDYADGLLLVGDTSSFVRRRLPVDSVARAFGDALRRLPGVHRADLLADLAAADTTTDVIARRWLHTFAPGGPVRLVTTLERFNYWHWITNVTHGGPWREDVWVPLVFWGAPFRRVRHESEVRVVDLAPTLAAALGVTPTEPLDGVVLRELLVAPPAVPAPH
jgi:arylsulfatase A-like enzyme